MSDFTLPGAPLFWTVRRRRLWRSCRRRYFLHYYAAAAGIDPGSPRELRTARLLRDAVALPVFTQKLLNKILREQFYREPDDDGGYGETGGFQAVACRLAEYEWNRAVSDAAAGGGRAPLLELLACRDTMTEVGARLRELVISEAGRIASGVWKQLDAVESCRRRPIASPLELWIGELRCFAVPAIAFSTPGGELWIVEGVRSGREGADEIALLHKFYAMNTLNRPPETVRSFALAPGKYDFSEFGRDVDLSAAIREIKHDIGEMAAALNSDGSASEGNFPAAPGKACENCPFRTILCSEK